MQTTISNHVPQVGDPAPASRLATQDGNTVELESYWTGAANGAVVVMLRNFGCLFCRAQAKALRDAYDQIVGRDVNLVAVGVGTPADAEGFASWLKLPFPVLGHHDTSVHAQWGLGKSNAGAMLKPGLMTSGARAVRSGSMQGKPTGDSKQLPGVFLVDRGGTIRWAHRAEHAGDNPSIDTLLAAIDGPLVSP